MSQADKSPPPWLQAFAKRVIKAAKAVGINAHTLSSAYVCVDDDNHIAIARHASTNGYAGFSRWVETNWRTFKP